MKHSLRILLAFIALAFIQSPAQASGSPLDPEHKDEEVRRIHAILRMPGALQPDLTAVRMVANEWTIDVELVRLDGETAEEAEASWSKFLKGEKNRILAGLREDYEGVISDGAKGLRIPDELTEETAKALAHDLVEYDGRLLVQEGSDHAGVRRWLNEELLTRAGGATTRFYFGPFGPPTKRKLDYFRYHWHDRAAEVIGKDILFIRGTRNVIVIRVDYAHA